MLPAGVSQVGFGNPDDRVGRLAIRHRERLEVKTLSFRALAQELPIVSPVIDRGHSAFDHRRAECVGAKQSTQRLTGKNQTGSHLKHLAGTKRRFELRQGGFRNVVQRGGILCLGAGQRAAKRQEFAGLARAPAQPFIAVEN